MSKCMLINLEVMPGTNIEEAISEAKFVALQLNCAYCKFTFNDKVIYVKSDSDVDKIVSLYSANKLDQFVIC